MLDIKENVYELEHMIFSEQQTWKQYYLNKYSNQWKFKKILNNGKCIQSYCIKIRLIQNENSFSESK